MSTNNRVISNFCNLILFGLISICFNCSGGGSDNLDNNNENPVGFLVESDVSGTTFNVDPDSDIATNWYSCPSVTAGSTSSPCDLPVTATIEFINDALHSLVIRISNGDVKTGNWLFVDPDIIVTYVNGRDEYWETTIDGNVISMDDMNRTEPGTVSTSSI